MFLGDHLNLRDDPDVAKLMAKHGEPPFVMFSESVLKINRRGEAVPRSMLVCARSVYLLDADTRRVRRKLPIRELGAIRMSELSDNFIALTYPAEYDVLLVCARKIEAVVAIQDARAGGGGVDGGGGGVDGGGGGVNGGGGGVNGGVDGSGVITVVNGAEVVVTGTPRAAEAAAGVPMVDEIWLLIADAALGEPAGGVITAVATTDPASTWTLTESSGRLSTVASVWR
jgi:hypothetical protein